MRTTQKTIRSARRLRKAMSLPEVLLWAQLRAFKDQGIRFRRQHPVGPFVLDFYCAEARLAIEVDGMVHRTEDRPQRDLRRDAWLAEQGITVNRFEASAILKDLDAVAYAIELQAGALMAGRSEG